MLLQINAMLMAHYVGSYCAFVGGAQPTASFPWGFNQVKNLLESEPRTKLEGACGHWFGGQNCYFHVACWGRVFTFKEQMQYIVSFGVNGSRRCVGFSLVILYGIRGDLVRVFYCCRNIRIPPRFIQGEKENNPLPLSKNWSVKSP